jgi:hypothetical protein
MTGRDMWGSDDPNRVDPPDDDYPERGEKDPDDAREEAYAEELSERLREQGRLGEVQHGKDYHGNLLEDSEAAMTPITGTQALRDVAAIFNDVFTKEPKV